LTTLLISRKPRNELVAARLVERRSVCETEVEVFDLLRPPDFAGVPAMHKGSLTNAWQLVIAVAIAIQADGAAWTAEPPAVRSPVMLTSLEGWHTVFGDTRIVWSEHVHSEQQLNAVLAWTCRLGSRIIAQGEMPVRSLEGDSDVKITLPIPPVKDGAVLAASLSLTLTSAGETDTLASAVEPLWVFSAEPFLDRDPGFAIRLFDSAQTTAAVLSEAGLRPEVLNSAAEIEELNDGVLVVGEDIPLGAEDDLPGALLKAAGRGVLVLVLAPRAGEVELPGELDRLRAGGWTLTLGGSDIISRIDKRLDAAAWHGASQMVSSGLGLRADQDRQLLVAGNHSAGWPWIELTGPLPGTDSTAADAGKRRGRLIVCGFSVIKHWPSGPTPRYLFARSLERLAGTNMAAAPSVDVEEK
jgi:hypothetical protein